VLCVAKERVAVASGSSRLSRRRLVLGRGFAQYDITVGTMRGRIQARTRVKDGSECFERARPMLPN
jgi:hypothetical protein